MSKIIDFENYYIKSHFMTVKTIRAQRALAKWRCSYHHRMQEAAAKKKAEEEKQQE